jgi:hypothetical protein
MPAKAGISQAAKPAFINTRYHALHVKHARAGDASFRWDDIYGVEHCAEKEKWGQFCC